MRIIVAILIFIFFISCVVIMVSCTVRKTEPFTGETFAPTKSHVARGETLFMENCHKCHPAGEAGLGPSVLANPAPQFIKRFQMRHGLGVMPAFGKKQLSRKDMKDISAYLKAWKKY